MSDYYNQYNVRDAYWKSVIGPLTLFMGRQIVTWGESLAFRIGRRYQSAGLHLELRLFQPRAVAAAAVDGASDLEPSSWGPFTANFVEGVWTPSLAADVQPLG